MWPETLRAYSDPDWNMNFLVDVELMARKTRQPEIQVVEGTGYRTNKLQL
jgi:hypothetical protein